LALGVATTASYAGGSRAVGDALEERRAVESGVGVGDAPDREDLAGCS
jgi:hypothetical protein